MEENAREIVWIKAARKAFSKFPMAAQNRIITALRIAAAGQKPDIAKPMKGLGSGVFEIALAYRSDAFRTIYAVNIGDRLIVVSCVPEEIEERHQNAENRRRSAARSYRQTDEVLISQKMNWSWSAEAAIFGRIPVSPTPRSVRLKRTWPLRSSA